MTTKWNNAHIEACRGYSRKYHARTCQSRIDFILEQKTGKVCATCGESDTTKLLFHHVDKATKCFTLGGAGKYYSKTTILAEIAKCVILCRSCHSRLHAIAQHNCQVS